MTKFFFLSFFTTFFFMSTFSPESGLNIRPLKKYLGNYIPKFDCFADDGSYYMGSDSMALSIIYLTLLYHRMWFVALPLMGFDLLYYGPAIAGGPSAAIVGALCLL
jgi:hypothetical protein